MEKDNKILCVLPKSIKTESIKLLEDSLKEENLKFEIDDFQSFICQLLLIFLKICYKNYDMHSFNPSNLWISTQNFISYDSKYIYEFKEYTKSNQQNFIDIKQKHNEILKIIKAGLSIKIIADAKKQNNIVAWKNIFDQDVKTLWNQCQKSFNISEFKTFIKTIITNYNPGNFLNPIEFYKQLNEKKLLLFNSKKFKNIIEKYEQNQQLTQISKIELTEEQLQDLEEFMKLINAPIWKDYFIKLIQKNYMTFDELMNTLEFIHGKEIILNQILENKEIDLFQNQEQKNLKTQQTQQQPRRFAKNIQQLSLDLKFKGKGAISTVFTGKVYNQELAFKILQLSQINGWDSTLWLLKGILLQIESILKFSEECVYIAPLKYIYFAQQTLEISEVTEIFPGSLRKLINEHSFTDEQIQNFIQQIVEVLNFYEKKQYVHANLSLSTILLTNDLKEIRIIDQGMCKIATSIAHSNENEEVQSSVKYMAPEQFSSEDLTTKIDIYAFGIILYELCTKKPSFANFKQSHQFFLHQLSKSKIDFLQFNEEPSNNKNYLKYKNLIKKCVSMDMNQRPLASQINLS